MIETISFGEILQKLRDKYTSTPFTAQNTVKGMSQMPKEGVADYAARMRVAAKGLFPSPPRELKILIISTSYSVTIPNPLKLEEQKEYTDHYKRSEATIASNYLQGLRPEIQIRLNSRKYENLTDIINEAEAAQWMHESMQTGILHHIDEVNLLTPNFVQKKNSYGTKSKTFYNSNIDKEPKKCFACGSLEHFISNCPEKNKTMSRSFNRFSTYRSR
jgi:hypothetical protein